MPLHKIREFYPDYRQQFENDDIIGYGLNVGDEKVGSIDDLLVDDSGRFRYLVINTGAWIFGKKVLLPIGRSQIDYSDRRVYVNGLTRHQVENLPEYDEDYIIDDDYEDRVRGVYGTNDAYGMTSLENDAVTYDAPVANQEANLYGTTTPGVGDTGVYNAAVTDRNLYGTTPGVTESEVAGGGTYGTSMYDRYPDLYDMSESNHRNLRLYEERLIAGKVREKSGEVSIGKRVDTETQRISVPVDKERVVIERVNPTDAGSTVTAGADAFTEGEVARMEIYEERPDIRKETFVREELRVSKEVTQETVAAEETVRKERLDINKEGNLRVEGDERLRDSNL